MKSVVVVYPDAPPGRTGLHVVEGSEREDIALVYSRVQALQSHHHWAAKGGRPGEGDATASLTECEHQVIRELDTHLTPRVTSSPIIPQ